MSCASSPTGLRKETSAVSFLSIFCCVSLSIYDFPSHAIPLIFLQFDTIELFIDCCCEMHMPPVWFLCLLESQGSDIAQAKVSILLVCCRCCECMMQPVIMRNLSTRYKNKIPALSEIPHQRHTMMRLVSWDTWITDGISSLIHPAKITNLCLMWRWMICIHSCVTAQMIHATNGI